MKLYHKLLLAFAGVAFLVGVVGYFSYQFHDSTGYEVVQLKESAVQEIKHAGHMAQALHASQVALHELIEEYYQAMQDPAAASETAVGTGKARRTLQEIFFQFERYLSKSRKATETGKTNATHRGEDDEAEDEEEELTWLADLDEAFQQYRAFTEEFIRLMEQDGEAAVAYLETDLEPHFRKKLLPLIDQYTEDAHEEFEEKAEQVQAYVDYVGWQMGLISGLAVLVALVLGLLIARSIARPLGKLTQAARAIGQGNLEKRIKVASRDEVGLLAATFNRMVDNLSRTTVSKAYVDNIIASMADPLVVTDINRTIQRVNQATLDLLGYREEEMLGQPVALLFDESYEHSDTLMEKLEQDGFVGRLETYYRTRQDASIPVSFSGAVLRGNQGQEQGLVCVAKDMTERERYEQELVAAKEKAEEMTRLKDAFLTNMTHEIRTPLATIIGFADLLIDEVPEAQRESVEFMKDGGGRLLETLNAVLDLAHLEANSFELALEPVDVSFSLRRAAGLFSGLAQKKALDLRIDLPEAPVFIEADRAGLERILGNLISNAVKFTETGWVVVRASAGEAFVHIEVEDTGIGIDEAFMPHLFDEFKQESTGLSRNHEGSGLGLAIVKRLVEAMEGTIAVQSMKGHGSRFTLSFPRVSPSEQAEDSIEQPEQPAATAPAPVVGQPTRHAPLRILMAEDNPINQKVLLRLLERLGYTADVVGDGREVLEALERTTYDVILMDIQMPEMNGLEATRQICARYAAAERPRIVAVTANAMAGDRERGLAAGMDDYLSKPVRLEELGAALRRCLPSETADMANRAPDENRNGQPAVDAALLQALRNTLGEDDPASLSDLLTLFLEDATGLLETTRRAAETGDRAALQRAAHTLKSTGAAFGAMRLSRLCRELEQMSKEGNLGEAAAKAVQAQAAFSEVQREIQTRWLN